VRTLLPVSVGDEAGTLSLRRRCGVRSTTTCRVMSRRQVPVLHVAMVTVFHTYTGWSRKNRTNFNAL